MLEPTDCHQSRPATKSGKTSMAYPNLRQAIWLLVLFFIIQACLYILADFVDQWPTEDELFQGMLLPALFGHALNNFISVAAGYVDIPEGTAPEDSGELTSEAWTIFVAGAALAALGLWWFNRVSSNLQHIPEGRDPLAGPHTDAV